jgi:uncharacterized protein involved in response to NO
MLRVVAGPESLSTWFGHAHEMLLGYALAVVAGNQLPPLPRSRAALLFGLWAAARLAFITLQNEVAFAFDVAFAIALALHVAPRLFRAAKKLRNQALPLVVTALCAGAIAIDAAFVAGAAAPRQILAAIVLLLATLMLFMGGRIIAPAVAGQLHRQGESLAARVQPRIEGLLLVNMAAAVLFALLPEYDLVLRVACATAGALALLRLLRWRLWKCNGRPDLLCLGAGYAWLALGLAAVACTSRGNARTAALHLITIGALGTLTLNVMASTMLLKLRRSPATERIRSLATALIGGATVLRVAATSSDVHGVDLLIAAAACWTGAFIAASWLVRSRMLAFGTQDLATTDSVASRTSTPSSSGT